MVTPAPPGAEAPPPEPALTLFTTIPILYCTRSQIMTILRVLCFWRMNCEDLLQQHSAAISALDGIMTIYEGRMWETSFGCKAPDSVKVRVSPKASKDVPMTHLSDSSLVSMGLHTIAWLCAAHDHQPHSQPVTVKRVKDVCFALLRLGHVTPLIGEEMIRAHPTVESQMCFQAKAKETLQLFTQPMSDQESEYVNAVARLCIEVDTQMNNNLVQVASVHRQATPDKPPAPSAQDARLSGGVAQSADKPPAPSAEDARLSGGVAQSADKPQPASAEDARPSGGLVEPADKDQPSSAQAGEPSGALVEPATANKQDIPDKASTPSPRVSNRGSKWDQGAPPATAPTTAPTTQASARVSNRGNRWDQGAPPGTAPTTQPTTAPATQPTTTATTPQQAQRNGHAAGMASQHHGQAAAAAAQAPQPQQAQAAAGATQAQAPQPQQGQGAAFTRHNSGQSSSHSASTSHKASTSTTQSQAKQDDTETTRPSGPTNNKPTTMATGPNGQDPSPTAPTHAETAGKAGGPSGQHKVAEGDSLSSPTKRRRSASPSRDAAPAQAPPQSQSTPHQQPQGGQTQPDAAAAAAAQEATTPRSTPGGQSTVAASPLSPGELPSNERVRVSGRGLSEGVNRGVQGGGPSAGQGAQTAPGRVGGAGRGSLPESPSASGNRPPAPATAHHPPTNPAAPRPPVIHIPDIAPGGRSGGSRVLGKRTYKNHEEPWSPPGSDDEEGQTNTPVKGKKLTQMSPRAMATGVYETSLAQQLLVSGLRGATIHELRRTLPIPKEVLDNQRPYTWMRQRPGLLTVFEPGNVALKPASTADFRRWPFPRGSDDEAFLLMETRAYEARICWYLTTNGPTRLVTLRDMCPVPKAVMFASEGAMNFFKDRPELFQCLDNDVSVRPDWRQRLGLPELPQ